MIITVGAPRNDPDMQVDLSEDQLEQAYNFALATNAKTTDHEFMNTNTASRTAAEKLEDVFIGKVGELGVQAIIQKLLGVELKLDFNVYPADVPDQADTYTPTGEPVDIKSVKRGRYLMVEPERLIRYEREGRLPYALILVVVDCKYGKPTGHVTLKGFVYTRDLVDMYLLVNMSDPEGAMRGKAQYVREGEPIPGTVTPILTNNIALRADYLDTNWGELFRLPEPFVEVDF